VRFLRVVERCAWGAGAILLVAYGLVRVQGAVGNEQELERFEQARSALADAQRLESVEYPPADYRLWSASRIQAYEESLAQNARAPLAVLSIPRIGLEVAVLDGTDEITLNRGVGHIEGTAAPGEPGNTGIAGHRDGFFRGLKDVVPGDTLELRTLADAQTYTIEKITIVAPDAVDVLDSTDESSITLVTCYPFYHVGPAPRRYIVRAVRSARLADAVPGSSDR